MRRFLVRRWSLPQRQVEEEESQAANPPATYVFATPADGSEDVSAANALSCQAASK
jgi:hypothetical protein